MILRGKTEFTLILIAAFLILSGRVFSQPEVEGWGNLNGIRVEGQLMELNSSLIMVGSDWSDVSRTAKERQNPRFAREGNKQIVTTRLARFLSITETIEDAGTGSARMDVQLTSTIDTSVLGTFLSFILEEEDYPKGSIEYIEQAFKEPPEPLKSSFTYATCDEASGIRLNFPGRKVEISTDKPIFIFTKVNRDADSELEILLLIATGSLKKDQVISRSFTVSVEGEIDRDPVELVMNTDAGGRSFDGFGGNFRLQNPDTDPQVIEYCLENMRVAWARVEMPWSFWHQDEEKDPLEAARAGEVHERVKAAMELAQKIHNKGIPVILSVWSGPDWAIVGSRSFRPQPGGLRGNPLDPEKTEKIYESISLYIIYLKEEYGVEAEMFSFNESDLGIYIRQTGGEHRDLIKGLGTYFKSKGLKTKLLLGDTADANGWPFLKESMEDPGTLPYIGAVSFHSWRGWGTETLKRWADAAEKLGKPLIVGEGSTDAAAWRFPVIFNEQVYILTEINLYIRILAICQPRTILQWQLTADYSPMAGGGIFGDDGPLRPTQRFWNMKQISATPEGLKAMPITSSNEVITCAALGDNERNSYAIHFVNNGATRKVTVSGLPGEVGKYRLFITYPSRGMEYSGEVEVTDGRLSFMLDQMSYATLISDSE